MAKFNFERNQNTPIKRQGAGRIFGKSNEQPAGSYMLSLQHCFPHADTELQVLI